MVAHKEGGDVTADRRKSVTTKTNDVKKDRIPCTNNTHGIDKRSDERVAQLIQKMVKESMLSDSSSFDRA